LVILIPAVILLVLVAGIIAYDSSRASSFPFPCLENEGLVFHVHPWLRIIINGENLTIPAGIGIRDPVYQNGVAGSGSCFEPLHTHDSSGIIHIESITNRTYTLGDFFQVWKATYGYAMINGAKHPVIFNSTDIFGFKADASHKVVLLVDGKTSNSYQSLILNDLDYCSNDSANVSPCFPTAPGGPYYGGLPYPYGIAHTVTVVYVSSG
jgi:hypothetical protein